MNIEESLPHVRKYFLGCDWEKSVFCWKKAFISAVFSNMAYSHISNFEIANTKNVNLIPSSEYEKAIKHYFEKKEKLDIKRMLDNTEMEITSFLIENQFAIALVIKIQDVVFVSLRGTEFNNIFDWRINFNALKVSIDYPKVKLHRGFYKEVLSFKQQLENLIRDEFGTGIQIYVTGHSLGGALAAVLYGLWGKEYKYKWGPSHKLMFEYKGDFRAVSSYTFGMPRYGNLAAIAFYPNPYHVLNSKDIIPNVPPKKLGYENCANNIPLDKSLVLDVKYYGYLRYLKNLISLVTFKKLEHHSIENYVERIYHEVNKS